VSADDPRLEIGAPLAPAALLEQARDLARRREWRLAAQAYGRIINRPLPDSWGHVAFEYAAVLLLSGDVAGYKNVCAQLVERSGKDGVRPYHVARACSLAPGSVTPPERPGELAAPELKAAGPVYWSLWLQGALSYRTGRYAEALEFLQKSQNDRTITLDAAAGTRLWLALTYQRMNQPEMAQRAFEQADSWLKTFPAGLPPDAEKRLRLHLHNWLEVHVLQVEAKQLLAPSSPKKP
jgi:tetratricopeptide (TPR) repeat protein